MMKKIPTLFERIYENHKVVGITPKVTEGCEPVLQGDTTPTLKVDGSCCAVINGKFYKRYDAKRGKKPPDGAIPCCPPDPITGHHPHWVLVDAKDPADWWFWQAYNNTQPTIEGTYEAIGVHFQGNPYGLEDDRLFRHGSVLLTGLIPTFEGIRDYLTAHLIEGIVFWYKGEPLCKIKRSDFGLPWGKEKAKLIIDNSIVLNFPTSEEDE